MKPLIHVDTEEDMGGGLMDARFLGRLIAFKFWITWFADSFQTPIVKGMSNIFFLSLVFLFLNHHLISSTFRFIYRILVFHW